MFLEKMPKFVGFLLVLFICEIYAATSEEDKLLSVVQVFRHGERTPIIFYPTDPYKEPKYWNNLSTGQLTDYGKVQLIKLGKYFRERYDGFISTEYVEDEIYMTSVSSQRNKDSAASFLTGLYPDNDQDIPIHNTPASVMGSLMECLRYDLHYAHLELTDEYLTKINEENSEDYKYITEHSLFPVLDLATAFSVWDTLHIERRYNYTLPEWTQSVFPEKLTNISDIYAKSVCYDDTLQTLGSGVFMNEIIEHFESVLSNNSSQKIRLYSGHDTNIACLLNTLDAFSDPHSPDFASSVIFELRQSNTQSYINAYYKPNSEAVPINLRDCAFDCKFEDFKTAFKSTVITQLEWFEKCYILL